MKKFSKLLSLLLAVLMLSTVFAGCSAQDVADIAQTAYDIATIVEEVANTEVSEDTTPVPTELPQKAPQESTAESPAEAPAAEEPEALDPDGSYTTKEDVALYIHTYGYLPSNFMTKNEAREGGWQGGSLEPYFPGMCIGGDYFGNKEGLLPKASGRKWTECDIDTLGADSRGAKRIVFSNDGLIYYTDDHYESFTLLYGNP